ncbi:MAG: hypothetical protein OXC62_06625 [Aestuariivita sp.]|nr:hypothetical protein [Aestuariivita sp.]
MAKSVLYVGDICKKDIAQDAFQIGTDQFLSEGARAIMQMLWPAIETFSKNRRPVVFNIGTVYIERLEHGVNQWHFLKAINLYRCQRC